MLMSLLPGVRELRTPLVSGFLWLGCLWLASPLVGWGNIATYPEEPGLWQQLWDLGRGLGWTITLGALTLTAYLVGSLLEVAPKSPFARLGHYRLIRRQTLTFHSSEEPSRAADVTAAYDRVQSSFSAQGRADIRKYLERKVLVSKTDVVSRDAEVGYAILTEALLDEIPTLAARLLITDEKLHNRYDRLISEAALRFNVAAPLVVISLILGVRIDKAKAASWLVVLGGVLAAYLLVRQGNKRLVEGSDAVAQALAVTSVGDDSEIAAHADRLVRPYSSVNSLLVEGDSPVTGWWKRRRELILNPWTGFALLGLLLIGVWQSRSAVRVEQQLVTFVGWFLAILSILASLRTIWSTMRLTRRRRERDATIARNRGAD